MAENSGNEEPQKKRFKKDDTLTNQPVEEYRKEVDLGITEYISKHEGFTAVIKQRYSDFLVNEVAENGEIVHLTDTALPDCDKEEEKPCSPDLLELISEEQVKELKIIESSKKGELWIEVGDDKEKRTKLHSVIRENFDNLESSTTDKDNKKYIKVFSGDTTHNFNKHKHGKERKRRPAWPKGRGDYCQFVLYKENKDTPDAVNQIAKVLRMNAGQFHYAGTKDRRSKSSQLITAYRVTATRLFHLNKRFPNFIALGDFKYCKNPLKLGMLKGNHFTIILRNVTGTDEQINEGVNTLRNTGFINYFGMQRFGTTSVPTYHIGRAILQSKWSEVVDLILQPRNDSISEARKIWKETGDAKAALDQLGPHPCIERHLLMGLSKAASNDIVSALSYIPRNSRHMYLHSYQSYIWNCMVSGRIQKYGLKAVVGDLVLQEEQTDNLEDKSEDTKRPEPQIVTEENLTKFTIHDVVLPLPGYDVVLPTYDLADEYKELLQKDGLNMTSFKHKTRDYAMPGGYRHILVHPTNLRHEILSYEDYRIPLVLSDNDRLQGKEICIPETGGSLKAIKLELTLPRSAYATMALREVLKCDTSAAYQTSLNTT